MNNSARIIKNFIEFQRNVSTEKAIHVSKVEWVTGITSEKTFRKCLRTGRSWKEMLDTRCLRIITESQCF